jgi:hypothetical protein
MNRSATRLAAAVLTTLLAIAALGLGILGAAVAAQDLRHDDEMWDGLGLAIGGLMLIVAAIELTLSGLGLWFLPRRPRRGYALVLMAAVFASLPILFLGVAGSGLGLLGLPVLGLAAVAVRGLSLERSGHPRVGWGSPSG